MKDSRFLAAIESLEAFVGRGADSLFAWASELTNPLSKADAPECWRLPADHPHHPRERCYVAHPVGCVCDESLEYAVRFRY